MKANHVHNGISNGSTMNRKTRAIVARGVDKPPTIEEIELEEPRPNEAIVEIHAVGVCHADLAVLHGKIPAPFPIVLGHEGSGIVREVGSGITHVKPGDAVVLTFNPCEECFNCKQQLPSYCDEAQSRAFSGTRSDQSTTLKDVKGEPLYGSFFGQSSFSRLVIANRSTIIKVPQESNLKLFAPLGCGVQTGSGVVLNTLNLQAGDSIAVAGCGAVGMSAIMAARERGASIIIAVDLNEERLAIAKELGATHAINSAKDDMVEQIRQICPLPAGVMYAFDTTAVPKVIESMIEATGVRGKTVVVGATPFDKTISIQPLKFLNMGKHFIGSVEGDSYPPKAIPYLIELYHKGSLPLEKVVKYYKFEDFSQAFHDMLRGPAIKPVLVFDDDD